MPNIAQEAPTAVGMHILADPAQNEQPLVATHVVQDAEFGHCCAFLFLKL